MKESKALTAGKVVGIIANLVIVEITGIVHQNEICHIFLDDTKLVAEVIKVIGNKAYVQVFESTRGLKTGSQVEFSGHMLEVTLGPGILSKNYDGLQNDLDKMQSVFLVRGEYTFPLDHDTIWGFKPIVKPGDTVRAADWLGEVKENWMQHKIMVPFNLEGKYTVKSIAKEGDYKITDAIAMLIDTNGIEIPVNMMQKWPVKIPIKAFREKIRPYRLL
jgi:V/A-type H+-transporting ATPase subunit A